MPATTKNAKPAAAKAPRKGPTTKILAALKAKAAKATGPAAVAKLLPSAHGDEAIPARKAASKPVAPAKAAKAATKPAKAAKPAKASETAGNGGAKAPTGAKGKIIAMIDASKAGVSPGEIAKALGWPRAGGTISRAIKLAPFKVAKARDAEGVLRYSRVGG